MSFDLQLMNRQVLITGGTKGVGAAVVETLREAGAQIVTTPRSLPARSRGQVFGGYSGGHPLMWNAEEPVDARYIRISIPRREYLHLAEVEIYGRTLGEAIVAGKTAKVHRDRPGHENLLHLGRDERTDSTLRSPTLDPQGTESPIGKLLVIYNYFRNETTPTEII